MRAETLESHIRTKIRKSRRTVFLRDDFAALGGYVQVGRVLRQLEAQGRLVRIGKGLYAKARHNRITGKPMIAAPGGFDQAAKEALSRLGVQWELASAEKSYQAGSTHIPARVVVRVKGPFHRQIAYGKHYLSIERYSS
ncbi:conjugal transfer protein [Vreelandella sulfidaeris]|uniref:Conjugal transfer protein n=1 Tax=Vreelandella sulfidaeris TaxID=115553 RepID=A0A365TLB4_9GAMM|nr:conjugal transfer protein [Halomonas sulfidaeris]RBI65403.1 conjugal transfer protein [Halomonas sulfidaeris]